MSDETNAVAIPDLEGEKLCVNLSPKKLNPLAGKLVQRTEQSVLCGYIFGAALGFDEKERMIKPGLYKESCRFDGQFRYMDSRGREGMATECYLPGALQRAIKARLVAGEMPVEFAAKLTCDPDEPGGKPSNLGYSYGITMLRIDEPGRVDRLDELSYRIGLKQRPLQQLTDQTAASDSDDDDPGDDQGRDPFPSTDGIGAEQLAEGRAKAKRAEQPELTAAK